MRSLASAAVAGAVVLGLRESLATRRDPVAIVVDWPGEPPELGPVTVFFHPEVPEATLVLVQP